MAAAVSSLLLAEPASPPAQVAPAEQLPDPAASAAAEEETRAAARRAALARLTGGRLGTIATSARGILSPGQSAVVRRSLLGG